MMPIEWQDALCGAGGKTYAVALELLQLAFRRKSRTITLPNTTVSAAGISRSAKARALADLEKRGLIWVERRPRKSPIVRLYLI
jgi:hypothetical protein